MWIKSHYTRRSQTNRKRRNPKGNTIDYILLLFDTLGMLMSLPFPSLFPLSPSSYSKLQHYLENIIKEYLPGVFTSPFSGSNKFTLSLFCITTLSYLTRPKPLCPFRAGSTTTFPCNPLGQCYAIQCKHSRHQWVLWRSRHPPHQANEKACQ